MLKKDSNIFVNKINIYTFNPLWSYINETFIFSYKGLYINKNNSFTFDIKYKI